MFSTSIEEKSLHVLTPSSWGRDLRWILPLNWVAAMQTRGPPPCSVGLVYESAPSERSCSLAHRHPRGQGCVGLQRPSGLCKDPESQVLTRVLTHASTAVHPFDVPQLPRESSHLICQLEPHPPFGRGWVSNRAALTLCTAFSGSAMAAASAGLSISHSGSFFP